LHALGVGFVAVGPGLEEIGARALDARGRIDVRPVPLLRHHDFEFRQPLVEIVAAAGGFGTVASRIGAVRGPRRDVPRCRHRLDRAGAGAVIADIDDECDQQSGGEPQAQVAQPRQVQAAASYALVIAGGKPPIAHMLSGALAPSSPSPLRSTCWVARASARRALRVAPSSTMNCAALYQV